MDSRLDPSIDQGGSSFGGNPTVHGGSLHQGNIVNIRQTANRCLADLRITDPRYDKTRIQETKGGLLSDCYVWVLNNSEFCQWRDNDDQRLLWVKGDPGKGKTMLLCGIIDQFKTTKPHGKRLAYFFCQATDERLNTPTAVLRGLLFMLLDQDAFLISHIQRKYDTAGKALFEDTNAWQALSEIFTDILQDPRLQGVYLVVDALDECVRGLEQLLNLIVQTSRLTRAKWLVSSRNWPKIEELLCNVAHRLSLEVNAISVAAAVKSYIMVKVSQLAERKGYQDTTAIEIRQYLLLNANDTFLWVYLVCQELANVDDWDAPETIKCFPPGLDAIYGRMIRQLYESSQAEIYKSIIALLLLTYRPISLRETNLFIDKFQTLPERSIRKMIGYCGSFLTVREDTVYFVHQSAKDFLIEKQSALLFPKTEAAVHSQIFSKSVEAISRILKRDIYALGHPGFHIEDVSRPTPDPLATVRYACVYWVSHLVTATKGSRGDNMQDDVQDGGQVDLFLRSKCLYWIEALSLLKGISEGMTGLSRLMKLLQEQPKAPQLHALVVDVYRLLQTFRPAIESRPLQTYASAIVFSPTKRQIGILFQNERPQWFECKTELAEDWSACEVTLEGHTGWVLSAAFSADGQRVVSASADQTIKVWNAETGNCEATLEGHTGWVRLAGFSADGQRVVSASADQTIKVWNVETGNCEATLKVYTSWFRLAAFSADRQHIVLASDDNIIQVWNVETGNCEATLAGHIHTVKSAAFSADRQRIVSASSDQTIKIWNVKTGNCEATLEGHTNEIFSVAFSADRQHIVSASDDQTVKIWNAETGNCEATLEGHTNRIWSAAFSADGKRIVSASYDQTVKIWNVETGNCEATLAGHIHAVNSAAFSADRKHVVSASDDYTVKIWNAETRNYKATVEGHTDRVWSAAFSADGKRIVSASDDQTIKIWNAETGNCEATLEGHTDKVDSAAFSADRQHIISASNDNIIKVWNAETGNCKVTLEGHTSCVRLAAFSADGQRVVSASADQTIKVWNVETGNYEAILEGHTAAVNSAIFSADRQHVVSASDDQTVKIWNVETGNCEATLEGHTGWVLSAAFSADGQRVVSASDDETVKVWNAETGNCEATLEGHTDGVRLAAFSADGQHIVSASNEDIVKVWNVETGACLGTYKIGRTESVMFDPTGTLIHTDAGDIYLDKSMPANLDAAPIIPAQQNNYCLSIDHAWILKQFKEILWLPPEYRPLVSNVSVIGGRTNIVLGCASGRVYIVHLVRS